jgi:type II restriction enzyme
MELQMSAELARNYKSKAQQARVVTEAWGRDELFCVNCDSSILAPTPANNKAIDLICPKCNAPFQLKSKSSKIGKTVGDGAYSAMLAAIREDRTPNLLLMRYALPAWRVVDLILIPHFAFPESAIIKRNPLSPTARRAGWIGCNIDLSRITPEARIFVVTASEPVVPAKVRASYERLKPLREIKAQQRGWTLDVLNIVRGLRKAEFTNEEVYAFDRELEKLHPGNRHIRDKIRQQLQVLRDAGLLIHVESGRWRISKI